MTKILSWRRATKLIADICKDHEIDDCGYRGTHQDVAMVMAELERRNGRFPEGAGPVLDAHVAEVRARGEVPDTAGCIAALRHLT